MPKPTTPHPPTNPLLDAALDYADRLGWYVFPVHGVVENEAGELACTCGGRPNCKPGKHPATARGFLDATTDPEMIERWWAKNPDANIGIDLGRSGVGIVDDDAADSDLIELQTQLGDLDPDWTVGTGRGDHYYRSSNGTPIPTVPQAKLGRMIETKGVGGYSIAPPSRHITGTEYRWKSRDADEPPELPASWVDHLDDLAPSKSGSNGTRKAVRYADAPEDVQAFLDAVSSVSEKNGGGWLVSCPGPNHANGDRHPSLSVDVGDDDTLLLNCFAGCSFDEIVTAVRPKGTTLNWTPKASTAPTLGYTDVDHSERLRLLEGETMRYVLNWGSWIVWDGSRWKRDPRGVLAVERAKSISAALFSEAAELAAAGDTDRATAVSKEAVKVSSRARIESAVALARGVPDLLIDHEDLDADPWLLNVENGYLDLRTGTFHDPDPSKLMTMQATVEYDAAATAPVFEKALSEWLPDEASRRYLQRLAGSALVGVVRDHQIVFIYGEGGNGKGTFVGALASVLGDYFVVPNKSLLVVSKHEKHDTIRASLFRARLAVAAETESRVRLNEAQIKELTGGDRLSARRLYENEWSFDPSHTLWLQTNHLPQISGRDRGIWRRIRVFPWTTTFTGAAEDAKLSEKLLAERSGILNWVLEGVAAWQRDGLGDVPSPIEQATAAYKDDEDVFSRWLDEEGFVLDPDGTVDSERLIRSWAEWNENAFGVRNRRFNEAADALTMMGLKKQKRRVTDASGRRKQRTTWTGLREDAIEWSGSK